MVEAAVNAVGPRPPRQQVQDSLICFGSGTTPIDKPHQWTYQGKTSQRYMCLQCGRICSKARMKAETDGTLD